MDASNEDLSDYELVSEIGNRSPELSVADLGQVAGPEAKSVAQVIAREPPPSEEAKQRFETACFTAEDIQAFVAKFFEMESWSNTKVKALYGDEAHKTVRVYVDGQFDDFHAGHALQFRQAKLSFPNVHLIVGVFGNDLCEIYDSPVKTPHVERCEVIRHCRWVDEVLLDAPWVVDEDFVTLNRIDFVVLDDGISADPNCDKLRLGGYDAMKKLGTDDFSVVTHALANR